MFNFDNTYLNLPNHFHSVSYPSFSPKPELLLFNKKLLEELEVLMLDDEDVLDILSGKIITPNSTTFAQAYAGHQFGHFTMLGDGRAIHLGEHLTSKNSRFDIQLKGGGNTKYSRGGDGKATVKAMLREYLISEAMHYLKIPSSRSLAVIKSGNKVYREYIQEGAVLTRVMKSHIRIGTFEYARQYGSLEDIKSLLDYTIARLYPSIQNEQNPYLSFFRVVRDSQIELVCNWIRVGFIHGVMNTDNTSISSETFDYGPCSFMNLYDENTVYSSIDVHGRYSFGNQPKILQWNLARLAESILPFIDENIDKAISIANEELSAFEKIWKEKYHKMMLSKLGLDFEINTDPKIYEELLIMMKKYQLDYTLTFAELTYDFELSKSSFAIEEMKNWYEKWIDKIGKSGVSMDTIKSKMKEQNPIFIPRNHFVEEALERGEEGDMKMFLEFLEILKTPYEFKKENQSYIHPPNSEFEKCYKTYCGT